MCIRDSQYGADTTRILLAMSSGVPVICAAEIPENPVERAGCGKITPPQDPQSLMQSLEQLRALPLEERKSMGKRGNEYVNQNATISHQASSYWEALQAAVNQSKGEKTRS